MKLLRNKIESEELSEEQIEVILTFIAEYLKNSMKLKEHLEIKNKYRESKLIDFIKQLAFEKGQNENGTRAYDILARFFRDIKEEVHAQLQMAKQDDSDE